MNVTDDQNLGGNRVIRNYVRHDQNLVVKMDVSRGLRMSDPLDDLMTDVNRVNRNYAPRDRKMGANLDAMNHHVMYY